MLLTSNELLTQKYAEFNINNLLQNEPISQEVVMQAFNPNTPRPRQASLCEFNATLVCIGRSMSAKANRPCQKKETNQREWGDGSVGKTLAVQL